MQLFAIGSVLIAYYEVTFVFLVADCTKRVVCENGEAISERQCSNGWIFDYLYLSCISNGDCYPGQSISCETHSSPLRPYLAHPCTQPKLFNYLFMFQKYFLLIFNYFNFFVLC